MRDLLDILFPSKLALSACRIASQSTARKQAANIAKIEKDSKAGLVIQSEVQRVCFRSKNSLLYSRPITDQIHSQTKKYLWVPEWGRKYPVFRKLSALTILPNMTLLKHQLLQQRMYFLSKFWCLLFQRLLQAIEPFGKLG